MVIFLGCGLIIIHTSSMLIAAQAIRVIVNNAHPITITTIRVDEVAAVKSTVTDYAYMTDDE